MFPFYVQCNLVELSQRHIYFGFIVIKEKLISRFVKGQENVTKDIFPPRLRRRVDWKATGNTKPWMIFESSNLISDNTGTITNFDEKFLENKSIRTNNQYPFPNLNLKVKIGDWFHWLY